MGIRVSVVKETLTPQQFKADPSQSNRIWVGGRPLEEVLGATSGMSKCSGCCGESDCRTTIVAGRTYETLPPELIVRAGLKVAANMIEPAPSNSPKAAAGSGQFWTLTWTPFASEGPWFDYLQQQRACGSH